MILFDIFQVICSSSNKKWAFKILMFLTLILHIIGHVFPR